LLRAAERPFVQTDQSKSDPSALTEFASAILLNRGRVQEGCNNGLTKLLSAGVIVRRYRPQASRASAGTEYSSNAVSTDCSFVGLQLPCGPRPVPKKVTLWVTVAQSRAAQEKGDKRKGLPPKEFENAP
jgi:hypothetical protein